MQDDYQRPDLIAPINPLPGVVWLLALPMIVLEIAFSLADAGVIGGPQAVGWRVAAIEGYGVFPEFWRLNLAAGAVGLELLLRFFSFGFINGSATQALFGIAMVMALGKFVGEVFKGWAVALVFFGSGAIGALVYAYTVPHQPLFGAFPGVYGLIGAFSFLIWVRLAGTGVNQFRAFSLIGALLAVQLIFGAFFTLMPMLVPSMGQTGHDWSWVADLPGFAAGFLLSFVVSPGGFERVRDRIRQR
ncbi:MAG: rhomboid family intramembrane serine protease [Cypionkella sp.]|uniref:rhomboid family intramembrane serine protease n=1 Tax=Cypionkella sp. TaxID=2811411 RepID=UPI002ABB25B3|nr:rhomboid family intramembrane serine protease [Cypionkella sp.]MDZ4310177.1 rhomboid family intramembrane serine protease [Cypionkella sp.]MDZ4395027.1 rhomboid family intramembrane serine protease [Cypionkella sp.]